jgi:predicted acyltransferase
MTIKSAIMNSTQRYLALDVLRGITIASMITVNSPGSGSHIFAPLEHSKWHGCTPTDLVFPFFLFVVGVSMFFSFSKYNNSLNKDSLIRIGKRTFLIFAIGLFLHSFPQWMTDYSRLRILGVLQRIAIAYGIGSLIVLAVQRKYLPYVGGAILLLYWGILYYFGGSDPYSLAENAAIPFDKAILGESHLYKGFGIPFDPEGLLSTIPAIVTVMIGYMTGSIIKQTEKLKVPRTLAIYGIAGVVAGYIWSLLLPLNKPLWTSSYVLYAAGWALLVLAILIWIIDLKGYTGWTSFFVVFGMNPLFIFALSGLYGRSIMRFIHVRKEDGTIINGYSWLYQNVFEPLSSNPKISSLLFALFHLALFWLIGLVLYKKRIFIKV